VLIAWCWLAAVVLVVSVVTHLSTFCGINPLAVGPAVWLIHIAIFPPCIAASYYMRRAGGKDLLLGIGRSRLAALTAVLMVYAAVNFVIFIARAEGQPEERNGKYVLTAHDRVLREVDKAEYERQQMIFVRGFSGHWMLFSCAALLLLVEVGKRRVNSADAPSMPAVPAAASG
jgi:hypothetical protein